MLEIRVLPKFQGREEWQHGVKVAFALVYSCLKLPNEWLTGLRSAWKSLDKTFHGLSL